MFQFFQFLAILLYSVIVSQSFFYALGAGTALKRLSATAFIEQRHSLDMVIASRLKYLYLACVTCLVVLLFITCMGDFVFVTNIILALCCLLADMFIAATKNVPLNKMINSWSISDHPDNWQEIRDDWWRYFSWRMVASITGFLYFLGGVFFR